MDVNVLCFVWVTHADTSARHKFSRRRMPTRTHKLQLLGVTVLFHDVLWVTAGSVALFYPTGEGFFI